MALVEENAHLGGMSASGLGKSDIENRAAIRGFFAEFVERVHRHYLEKYGPDSENVRLCREGYYYEPSVAEATFDRMVGRAALHQSAEVPPLPVHHNSRGNRMRGGGPGSWNRGPKTTAGPAGDRRHLRGRRLRLGRSPLPAGAGIPDRSSGNPTPEWSISTTASGSFYRGPPVRATGVCRPTPTVSA